MGSICRSGLLDAHTSLFIGGTARGIYRVATLSIVVMGCALGFVGVASGALREGRAYEQVSPEFKGGYPVLGSKGLSALSVDGEAAAFASVGAFGGSGESFALDPYVARRTASGWITSGVFPVPSDGECLTGPNTGMLFSADISRFALVSEPGASFVQCERSPTDRLLVRAVDGPLVPVSPSMTTGGGGVNSVSVDATSSDLTRVVFARADGVGDHVLPEEINDEAIFGDELYEGEASGARLVGVDNSGKQLTRFCDVRLGSALNGAFGAVSQPDASTVFFSVPVLTRASGTGSCGGAAGHPLQLFVRLGGSRTVEVSRPLLEKGKTCEEVPCPEAALRAPAEFQGASEDGSRVFFTTAANLTAEDEDSGNDLYMATLGCPSGPGETCAVSERVVTALVQISHDPNPGQAAEVAPHVAAISPDGSHVYFVARGVLNATANAQSETAVNGAENLYVFTDEGGTGKVAFVAGLCSGPEQSATVIDARCAGSLDEKAVNDRGLWLSSSELGSEDHQAQTTPDGRYLVFGTYARLIESGPELDADSAEDVYRYDSGTGTLRRVSVGEAGLSGNGNGPFNAEIPRTIFNGKLQEQYELGDRVISADGSTVVFMSSEPLLSVGAVNAQQDVYVWHEGRVSMISSGTALLPDEEAVISPSGRDIMFLTSAGLVPGDTDGVSDLYDARVGGGFPVAAAQPEPCETACHSPLSAPLPTLVPGSVTQPAGGNLAPPAPAKHKTKPKRSTTKHAKVKKGRRASVRSRRAHARSGRRGRGGI